MQEKLTIILPSEYKDYCVKLRTNLKRPYLQPFIRVFYKDLINTEKQKIEDNIINFVSGKSYKAGIEYDLFTKFHCFLSINQKSGI